MKTTIEESDEIRIEGLKDFFETMENLHEINKTTSEIEDEKYD